MKRRGGTVFEATVALAVLALAYGGTAKMFTASAQQRHETDRQLVAQWEINNIAEQIAGMSYAETTQGTLDALQPSADARQSLSGAALSIELAEVGAPEPPHKRVNMLLSWNAHGGTPRTAKLTTWKYPPVAAQEAAP